VAYASGSWLPRHWLAAGMFALLSQASSQLESRYEKEALAVSGIGHPPTHYNSAGDLEDRYARVQPQCAARADRMSVFGVLATYRIT
jgi:phosphoketolase